VNKKTENNMTFRSATIEDAKHLFEWRNDPETRRQSINTDEVSWSAHLDWLERSLANPSRTLLVALLEGEFVGTIRLDVEEEKNYPAELSWTVAPSARGRGLGTSMVKEAAKIFNQPLRACIKLSNPASMKIAERAGFKKDSEEKGMTGWIYKP
jgi:RimJ/RimL family protein N-acetyltransferase